MNRLFRRFAEKIAVIVGTPWTFFVALLVLIGWGASGPLFGFSEHWQLAVNSFTTIVTFLMVFVIQNKQNRDFQALKLKLDELLRTTPGAHRGTIHLQELTDDELHRLERAYQQLREKSGATSEHIIEEISLAREAAAAVRSESFDYNGLNQVTSINPQHFLRGMRRRVRVAHRTARRRKSCVHSALEVAWFSDGQ